MSNIKIMKNIGAVFIILIVCSFIAIPTVNNYSANQVSKEIQQLPLPEKTHLVDSVSKAGKLVGNGNGMQFFGAILIQSELSLKELKAYYNHHSENDWEYNVNVQKDKSIDIIGHGNLNFSKEIQDDNYYIVYSWGKGIRPFSELDIRGH